MIRFLLSLFLPFRWFIERTGANYDQFIRILELKLTLDDRRVRSIKNNNTSEIKNSILKQSLGQIFMGVIFAFTCILVKSEFTYFYIAHIIIMVMMAMLIISDFTTVLFDTSENSIIQPLPIGGTTLSLARNAHIFLYLSLIAFNISIVTIIIAIVKFGILSGLVFLVSLFLNVLFTLFLSNILYLGIMHLATGEQLKNLMMYFQIVIAVLFMAGYQFGLNMIDKSQIMNMTISVNWYTYLLPPAVFSGFVEAISGGKFDAGHILFLFEALLIPVIAIFITTRYLTPVFNRKLLNLEQGDKATKVSKSSGRTTLYYRVMARVFTHRNEEKAAFHLAWRMSGYERLFKQSFFPSIAYVLVMVAVQFFKKGMNVARLAHSDLHMLLLYAFVFISFTLTSSILLGNNRQTEWMFKMLPVETPADYFKGFIKAVFVRFFNPIYLLLAIGIIAFWGSRAIPDILIAWMVIYLLTLFMFYIQRPEFPFSKAKSTSQGGAMFVKVMGVLLLSALLGFAHYYIRKWEIYGSVLLVCTYSVGIYVVDRIMVYKRINWEKIDNYNSY